jgi:hypothetical protein
MKQHSLPDQIAADRYLESKIDPKVANTTTPVRRERRRFTAGKLYPPGSYRSSP